MIKIKILFLGDSYTGKSSIIKKIKFPEVHINYIPYTIGVDFVSYKKYENNINMQIWDCSGNDRYQEIIKYYYKDANYIILVFDLTNITSFENIEKKWITTILKQYSELPHFILIGNKCDLEYDKNILYSIKKLCNKYNIKYFEISALENRNINTIFEYITNKYICTQTKINISSNLNRIFSN